MTQLEAFNLLLDIIKTGKRHPQYLRTCELAKDYRALSTGVGLSEKLHKYSIGQSDEAFAVQKEITIHITPSIISSLTYIYYRVPRSPGMKTKWQADNEATEKDFTELLENFSRDGFNRYMEQVIKDLIELDPNAWMVVEFKGTDGSKLAQPYPYIVYSENAIMYEYDIAKLKYLVDMHKVEVKNKLGDTVLVEQYTIYTEVGAVTVTASPDPISGVNLKQTSEVTDIPDVFNIDRTGYFVSVPLPYNNKQVPARCVGYAWDKVNNGKSFVNMYHPCLPYLNKSLKANSEMDVSFCKHVHPQKIQYVRACVKEGCSLCEDGKYYTDYETHQICPVCHGRGFTDVTQGGLEYLYFPLPNSKEEMLDLSNIVHYVQVDIETPQMLEKYVDHLTFLCRKTMFNQDDISTEDVQKTAKEILKNENNKNDTLRAYAVNYAIIYKFFIETIADIVQRNITPIADVSKDFNMRDLNDWANILTLVTQAGANESVIEKIQEEIMLAVSGETQETKMYVLKNLLIPFQSMSKELRALEVASLPRDDKYRVAAVYGNDILKTLDKTVDDFLDLAFEKQKKMFDSGVQERITELAVKEPVIPNFLSVDDAK